jgi:hypothetical protein
MFFIFRIQNQIILNSNTPSKDQKDFLKASSLSKITTQQKPTSNYNFKDTFYYNIQLSSGDGASIFISSSSAVVTMTNCYFGRSIAKNGNGGGYYFKAKTLTITFSVGYDCMAFKSSTALGGQFFYFSLSTTTSSGAVLTLNAISVLR